MKFLLFSILIFFTFNFGCKPASKINNKTFTPSIPIEELAFDLFEVIKKKDFNAFEKLMAKDKKIRKQTNTRSQVSNQDHENNKRIFDLFYEKNLDWEKMNINKITFKTRGSKISKSAQVTIKFSDKNNKCTLNFANWLKHHGEDWKIGGLPPEFNCLAN